MVRMITDEEKRLTMIFDPYFDYKKGSLNPDAPKEAIEALKMLREIAKDEINLENI